MLFRTLTPQEVIEFEQYARDNDPPDGNYDSRIHHPMCCDVWKQRGFMDKAANFDSSEPQ